MASRKPTPDNILFKEWYKSLPKSQRPGIRNIIIDRLGISRGTFDTFLTGQCNNSYTCIKPIYKRLINDIAGETIFNV